MRSQFGKSGPILLALAAAATIVLVWTTRQSDPKAYTAWVFDPSSARSYESLGNVHTEIVPSRILTVRVMAAALAKLPCAADVVELESGSSRRGLQPLDPSLAADLPQARLDLWRDDAAGGRLMALPRDVNPVVLAYRLDLWQSAGLDPSTFRTWSDFFSGTQTLHDKLRVPALELPTGNASIILLLLQQRGIDLRHGLDNDAVFQTFLDYRGWLLKKVSTNPARRIELTAEALASGNLAAVIVPDWRLNQVRKLIPSTLKLTLHPLPSSAPTPTWGGTGIGIPLHNDPAAGQSLLRALANPALQQQRFITDRIVPVSLSARSSLIGEDADFWQRVTRDIATPVLSGEQTAAVQRELNQVVRTAASPTLSHVEQIRDALKAADARLRRQFPQWGEP